MPFRRALQCDRMVLVPDGGWFVFFSWNVIVKTGVEMDEAA